jgi:hypothetical protein
VVANSHAGTMPAVMPKLASSKTAQFVTMPMKTVATSASSPRTVPFAVPLRANATLPKPAVATPLSALRIPQRQTVRIAEMVFNVPADSARAVICSAKLSWAAIRRVMIPMLVIPRAVVSAVQVQNLVLEFATVYNKTFWMGRLVEEAASAIM